MRMNHLYLRNQIGMYRSFNHARGRDNDTEENDDRPRDYQRQKERLGASRLRLINDRRERHEHRRNDINVAHWDMVEVKFLKHVAPEFADDIEQKYGLHAVRYSNFNQDVLFLISDPERFEQVFMNDLNEFCNSEGNDVETPLKSLTTISNFHYLTSELIKRDENARSLCSNSIIKLISDNRYDRENRQIKEAMMAYLNENAHVRRLTDDMIQIDSIEEHRLEELIGNFDIIDSVVQGLGKIRVIPDPFNDFRRALDFRLVVSDGLPVVGVLDTGTIAEEPFTQLDAGGIDLTNEHDYHSVHEGHGTTVASLASFGWNYYQANENAEEINADAQIYTIKVQNNAEGRLNIADIKQAIIGAHNDHGIRIFNLSMNSGSKNYNSDISPYAYILDALAYELDILIFISTGNLVREDVEAIQEEMADEHTAEEVRNFLRYPSHFYKPGFERAASHFCDCTNLNVPAESMNNMTIGALADNLQAGDHTDMSLGKGFPAYYTKKYYIDYNGEINGTKFNQNQRNKHIFKPDIVMPGGDVLSDDSAMEVISTNALGLCYIKNSGTSYAAPLAANLAAKVIGKYPNLNMQSVKALLINSADKVPDTYLNDTILKLKQEDAGVDDIGGLDVNQRRNLTKKYNAELLNSFISGHGMPNIVKCLSSTHKRVTLVIEDRIAFDSYKVMNLNLPPYINRHPGRTAIKLTATLCYKFMPKPNDALSYNPLHISFFIGKSMNYDNPGANAKEYSLTRKSDNAERMRIKGTPFSWSDDFYPASSKRFSNVQKAEYNFRGSELEGIRDQMSLVLRCTGRKVYPLNMEEHPFSLIITLEETDNVDLMNESLYDDLQNLNTLEAIGELAVEAEA